MSIKKYECIKDFYMAHNEVAFVIGKSYTTLHCDFCETGLYFDADETGSRHLMPGSLVDSHFKEIK